MLRFLLVGVGVALLVCNGGADEKADLDKLVKEMKAKDPSARLRALEAVAERGARAKAIAKNVCDAALDRNTDVAGAAVLALESVRPDLYKPVLKMVRDPNTVTKVQGLKELGELGADGLPAVRIVHTLIKDTLTAMPDLQSSKLPGIGYVTLRALKAEDHETIVFLKTLATTEGISTYMGAAITRDTPSVNYHRQVALEMLADWAGRDEERRKSIVPLIRAGFDNDVTVYDALRLAGAYGKLSKDMIPALKKLKVSPKAAVRDAAARALDAVEEQVKK